MNKIISKSAAISLIITALLCVSFSISHSSENVPSEESNQPSKAPKQTANHIEKITDTTPAAINTSVSIVSTPLNPNDTQSTQKKEEKSSDESWWFKLRTDPIAAFTFVLAVATFLLWLSTRRLVIGAEKTAERQLRAYLFTTHDDIPIEISNEGIISITTMIKNFGQTPAGGMVTSHHIGLYRLPISLSNPLDKTSYGQDKSSSHLAPGEVVYQRNSLGRKFSANDLLLIESGDCALFVTGEIKYTDIFTKHHCTKFCLFSTGEAFKRKTISYYHSGNNAY